MIIKIHDTPNVVIGDPTKPQIKTNISHIRKALNKNAIGDVAIKFQVCQNSFKKLRYSKNQVKKMAAIKRKINDETI